MFVCFQYSQTIIVAISQSPPVVIPAYSPINQDYCSKGRIKSYCILFEDIYYSLESFGSIQTGQDPPFIVENLK